MNTDHQTFCYVSLQDKVVESILDDNGLTGDDFCRLLDILGALVVTPGVDYLET